MLGFSIAKETGGGGGGFKFFNSDGQVFGDNEYFTMFSGF